MNKYYNLQLFDDGGEGGSGAQGGNAGGGNGSQNSGTGKSGGYSFEQAEEIANARAQRAEKAALSSYFKQQGMSEAEIEQAIKDFKAKKDASQPNVSALEKERDEAKAALEAMKSKTAIEAKGVSADAVEFVQFKVAALMKEDSKLDFDKALDKFLKDNPRFSGGSGSAYRVKTGTDGAQGSGSGNDNSIINDAIRKAARR